MKLIDRDIDLLKKFTKSLKEEISKDIVERDIHDEIEENLDSDNVWMRIDSTLCQYTQKR